MLIDCCDLGNLIQFRHLKKKFRKKTQKTTFWPDYITSLLFVSGVLFWCCKSLFGKKILLYLITIFYFLFFFKLAKVFHLPDISLCSVDLFCCIFWGFYFISSTSLIIVRKIFVDLFGWLFHWRRLLAFSRDSCFWRKRPFRKHVDLYVKLCLVLFCCCCWLNNVCCSLVNFVEIV